MNGPKFRFTVVMGFVLLLWWGYSVVSAYLIGEHGLNASVYLVNALFLIGLIGLGYVVVWLMLRATAWHKQGLAGFEPNVIDEYGTEFRMGKTPFPLRLSRLLPAHMEALPAESMTQLEYEIIGFLNSLRHLKSHFSDENIYEAALRRWHLVRNIPGATPYYSYFALSLELGVFYTIQEKRFVLPSNQFWKHDIVSSVPRAELHGGLSAFVLSVLPSFRALASIDGDNKAKLRALLAALQSATTPEMLPTNIHPLGRELMQLLPLFQKFTQSNVISDEAQIEAWTIKLCSAKDAILKQLEPQAADFWVGIDDWAIIPYTTFWNACANTLGISSHTLQDKDASFIVSRLTHVLNGQNSYFRCIYVTPFPVVWSLAGQEIITVALKLPRLFLRSSEPLEHSKKLALSDHPLFNDQEILAIFKNMSKDFRKTHLILV